MARVFVSYASKDQGLATEVHRWLIDDGHDAFLDRDLRDGIALGDDWRHRLHERMRWADAVVCVVTSAYLASTWCTCEVATARERGSRLLPLFAELDIAHPLLTDVQHTDLVVDPNHPAPGVLRPHRRGEGAHGTAAVGRAGDGAAGGGSVGLRQVLTGPGGAAAGDGRRTGLADAPADPARR